MIRSTRGFALTLDTVIAMIFVLVIALALSAQRYSNVSESTELAFVSLHYISEDALDVLNKKGVLDQIGELWTSNNSTGASDLAKLYLDEIVPQNTGYDLWIYNNTTTTSYVSIANRTTIPIEMAIAQTYSLRFLVGYKKGEPVLASVSRAFLTGIESKTSSAYAYFGGFEGQGNLTKYLYVPDDVDVTDAYIEVNAGSPFTMYVSGAGSGTCTPPFSPVTDMSANIKWPISGCTFGSGKNIIDLRFTSGDIIDHYMGGGFIRVTYNTTKMNESASTSSGRFEFPGVDGLINYYGSFYVPGTITSMTAHLVFQNDYTTFFSVGGASVYTSLGSPVIQTVDLDNTFMQSKLNYNDISEKTIPLRLGTSNISSVIQEGNADVVLITDLSLSMGYRLSSDSSGITRTNCSDEATLLQDSTKRGSLAKCLDKQFVNLILNNSGNRVALVGFSNNADDYTVGFTSDEAALASAINSYPDGGIGYTCICCAINKAYELFSDDGVVISYGEDAGWKYRLYSGGSCGDNCNPADNPPQQCTPTDWEKPSGSETGWSSPTSIPFSMSSSRTFVYFRKHFNLSYFPTSNATLSVRHRQGVQCYINGKPLPDGNLDPDCQGSGYGTTSWSISSSDFFIGSNLLACRVRSRRSSPYNQIYFDAELSVPPPSNKFIIVMSDGVTNYRCGSTCQGTSTSGQSQFGCLLQCTGDACDCPINNTIWSATRAHDSLPTTIHSVGFGPVVNCTNGNNTLWDIARVGNGSYCASTNATQLRDCYIQFANDILHASVKSQIINITGVATRSILYPDSYIDYTYVPNIPELQYGEITLTYDTPRFDDNSSCTGSFYIPADVSVIDAKATSYSSEHWTDYLEINSVEGYDLSDYGSDYFNLGDPYTVYMNPANIFSGQNNTVYIRTGDSPANHTGCSRDDRAILTVKMNGAVGYGDSFPIAQGCKWDIGFEDGSSIVGQPIPLGYVGNATCTYPDPSFTINNTDAINDAVYRVLQKLDLDGDGLLDIMFDPNQVEIDPSRVGGVRSLYGPVQFKLVVWI